MTPNSILTISGSFDFANPRIEDVHAHDIIVGLARENRFGRQTTKPYSVAQHSILVAALALKAYGVNRWHNPWEVERDTFQHHLVQLSVLHDASEAFMGDIPTPLKVMLPDFNAIEERVMAAVHSRFGVVPQEKGLEILKLADRQASLIERDHLQPWSTEKWSYENLHPGIRFDDVFNYVFDDTTAFEYYGSLFYSTFPMVSGHVH